MYCEVGTQFLNIVNVNFRIQRETKNNKNNKYYFGTGKALATNYMRTNREVTLC
jgi:hypothetical protein